MREYWDNLAQSAGVARATGVNTDLDTEDIEEVCRNIGWSFAGSLLDVGCGTGRMARHSADYRGVDIAPSMVAFAVAAGLNASLIATPDDLPEGEWDQGVMLSVMTHIDRLHRQEYLAALRPRVRTLLVDILPGSNDGDYGRMTAQPEDFESDLSAAGFTVQSVYERRAGGGILHRYYRVE